jgi:CubicO group peptidase (beta-lactamase class C family)
MTLATERRAADRPRRPRIRAPLASTHLSRCVAFNLPTSHDQARMPQRHLAPSAAPRALPRHPSPPPLESLAVAVRPDAAPLPLAELLAATGTTGFVAAHRGRLVWEHDPNGGGPERPQRCFSVTKWVASALLGLATRAGCIDSLHAPIGLWLPELRGSAVAAPTLAQLLQNHSGIRFPEGVAPWRDEPRSYCATDLRQRLPDCRIGEPVGAFFRYNDWHPLLLRLVLERATGQSVTSWLQQQLRDPPGAEHAAGVMVDRVDADGPEHLESGLNATALDPAKFGRLHLQDGVWQGTRLLPEGWVRDTTGPQGVRRDAARFAYYRRRPRGRFLAGGRDYYRSMSWGSGASTNSGRTISWWACSASTSTCRPTPRPSSSGCRIDSRAASGGRRCSGASRNTSPPPAIDGKAMGANMQWRTVRGGRAEPGVTSCR